MFKTLNKETQVILKVICAGIVLWVLWLLRDVLIILLLSLILTSAMEPMVDYFKLKKIPRSLSVLAVYVLVLGFLGLLAVLITPIIIDQFRALMGNLPGYSNELRLKFPGLVYALGNFDFAEMLKKFTEVGGAGSSVFARTIGVFNGLFTFVTVLVISFYLSVEEDGMKKFIKNLVPVKHQDYTYLVVTKVQKKMGRWVVGQCILGFSIFALSWIGLTILGVENALFLAILAGAFEVVPYIGPILSAIPAMLIAVAESPVLAIGVLVLYLFIQKVEGLILVPKVMQKTIGVSPIAILLALLAGFKLAGIVGLLLAVPIVGIITVLVEEWPSITSRSE